MAIVINRRSFVSNMTGAAAVCAVAPQTLMQENWSANPDNPEESDTSGLSRGMAAMFCVTPRLLIRMDPTSGVRMDAAPWAFGVQGAHDLGALLERVTERDVAAADNWLAAGSPESTDAAGGLKTLLSSDVLGGPNLGDVVGPFVAGMYGNREVGIDLQFGWPDTTDREIFMDRDHATDFSIVRDDTYRAPGAPAPEWRVPIPVSSKLRYQLRYSGDKHPLGRCVRYDVRHLNWEVQAKTRTGRWPTVLNYHITIIKENARRCLVIWENEQSPRECFYKRCSWTRRDLQQLIETIIVVSAAAAGVALLFWLVAPIAATVLAVLAPALAVLPVVAR